METYYPSTPPCSLSIVCCRNENDTVSFQPIIHLVLQNTIQFFVTFAIETFPNENLTSYNPCRLIRTPQFQELLTQLDTIQRQSIDQNLRKLAETTGFAVIYTQNYSGYFKDIKDYIYFNGEKYRPQDISPLNIFSFVTLKNEILAFLG